MYRAGQLQLMSHDCHDTVTWLKRVASVALPLNPTALPTSYLIVSPVSGILRSLITRKVLLMILYPIQHSKLYLEVAIVPPSGQVS